MKKMLKSITGAMLFFREKKLLKNVFSMK